MRTQLAAITEPRVLNGCVKQAFADNLWEDLFLSLSYCLGLFFVDITLGQGTRMPEALACGDKAAPVLPERRVLGTPVSGAQQGGGC